MTYLGAHPVEFDQCTTPSVHRAALSRTERLVLMMDGQPVGAPQESASWFIEGALRGPHDLVVQRTTTRGKTIALSEPVRVYVLRPSIR
jgi:hypothetical protein